MQEAEQVFLTFAVLAKLRAGFRGGNQSRYNERILVKFLNTSGVDLLFADEQTSHYYADLFFYLRELGKPIPSNDLWTAALVIQHDVSLVTRDRHFDLLPQISRI